MGRASPAEGSMSLPLRRLLAWALLALTLVTLALALLVTVAADQPLSDGFVPVLATAVWAGVGAALSLARPRNAVGWLLLATGVALGLSLAGGAYINWSEARGKELPAAAVAAWASSLCWIVVIAYLIPRVMLVFPDGQLPSPRWRVVSIAQYVVLSGITVAALLPGPQRDGHERYDNPVGIPALDFLNHADSRLGFVGAPIFLLSSLGAAAALIVRFWKSHGVERQQLKLVAWAVSLIVFVWVGGSLLPAGVVQNAVGLVAITALALAPLTILAAVLRYRLYDIDTVISKTLVYAAVTVVLGVSYVGLVLGGQAVFSTFAGGSNLAIAASTLVVAALFLPVRSHVQRFVDRRFYRRRYDAQRTLERFGARLREQIDLGTLEHDLTGVVTETMQPAHASVWLREVPR
jgi:hypothetical protein